MTKNDEHKQPNNVTIVRPDCHPERIYWRWNFKTIHSPTSWWRDWCLLTPLQRFRQASKKQYKSSGGQVEYMAHLIESKQCLAMYFPGSTLKGLSEREKQQTHLVASRAIALGNGYWQAELWVIIPEILTFQSWRRANSIFLQSRRTVHPVRAS